MKETHVDTCTLCPMYSDGGQGAGLDDAICMHPDMPDEKIFLTYVESLTMPIRCPLLEEDLLIKVKKNSAE